MNALILLTALIVALVVITSTNQCCVSVFYASWLLSYSIRIVLHTVHRLYGTSAIRRTHSWREPYVQYYTSCIIYCSLRPRHVVLLHQTNHAILTVQLWPNIRQYAGYGPRNRDPINEY